MGNDTQEWEINPRAATDNVFEREEEVAGAPSQQPSSDFQRERDCRCVAGQKVKVGSTVHRCVSTCTVCSERERVCRVARQRDSGRPDIAHWRQACATPNRISSHTPPSCDALSIGTAGAGGARTRRTLIVIAHTHINSGL